MVVHTLNKFDFDTLVDRINVAYYDEDTRNEREYVRRLRGELEAPHLAFKLMASTSIHEALVDPNAVDENEKKMTKVMANSDDLKTIHTLNVENAPSAAKHEINELLGKNIDSIKFSVGGEPFLMCVKTFCGIAKEVKIYKNLEDLSRGKVIRFPVAHLWKFSGEKLKDSKKSDVDPRVKWAFPLMKKYRPWYNRESWDVEYVKYMVNQDRIFEVTEILQNELKRGIESNNVIGFEVDEDSKHFVKWPNSFQGTDYKFDSGIEATSEKSLLTYKAFLKEFLDLSCKNVDDFTLFNWIRVLIHHHCKVDAFINDYYKRKTFEEINIIARLVSAHLDFMVESIHLKKWNKSHFEAVFSNLDYDLKNLITASLHPNPDFCLDSNGASTSGSKRPYPVEWEDSDSE